MTEVLITATEKEIAIPKGAKLFILDKVVFKPFSQLPNVNIGVTVSLYKDRKANEKKSSLWCNFKKELILNNTSFGVSIPKNRIG